MGRSFGIEHASADVDHEASDILDDPVHLLRVKKANWARIRAENLRRDRLLFGLNR